MSKRKISVTQIPKEDADGDLSDEEIQMLTDRLDDEGIIAEIQEALDPAIECDMSAAQVRYFADFGMGVASLIYRPAIINFADLGHPNVTNAKAIHMIDVMLALERLRELKHLEINAFHYYSPDTQGNGSDEGARFTIECEVDLGNAKAPLDILIYPNEPFEDAEPISFDEAITGESDPPN